MTSAELLTMLERCHESLTGRALSFRSIPLECPFDRLTEHGIELDSIEVLELVLLLEGELGRELEFDVNDDDWSGYTWGAFLRDIGRGVVSS